LPSAVPHQTKLLFATPECAPLVKTGGLGDVSAALPEALKEQGVDVRVLLPGYTAVLDSLGDAAEIARIEVLGHDIRLLEGKLPNGVPLWVAACPALYSRGGGPYQADDGGDWDDNALRFGALSKLAAVLGSDSSPLAWRPDIVHCNDWPTALIPVYLREIEGRRAATVVTIHNLAFQGIFEKAQVARIGLPAWAYGVDALEFYGRISMLKGGLVYADAITTVSPTYATEIQGEALGFGLDGVLRMRSDRLYGVLNGIDTATWNPMTDKLIAGRYGPLTIENKRVNRKALRARMGLDIDVERPIAGMVTRLTQQKGIDLVTAAVDLMVEMGWQVAVVGTGDRDLITRLEWAQRRHPRNFGCWIGFDESLAHLVEAGSDVFLMPSRFEPCGMNQMYSQRYGTPPIVNATGGLVDTVIESPPAAQTGFVMKEATVHELIDAASRAMMAYRDPKAWRAIQLHGMARDFGWDPAARKYREIYRELTTTSSAPSRSGG